jgi:pimeloyl-ACP methyl ester carboxylesterase
MVKLVKVASSEGEPRSNIIFVHGLGGDLYGTWRSGNDPRSSWPGWLAEDISGVAVYLLGYEASVSRWRGAAMHLTDRATSVLARILAEPQLQQGKMILVGHSLGGLVIKQLLRTADSEASYHTDAADLISRVEKVAFLATPHTGAGLANLGDWLRILVRPSAATACLVRNDGNYVN